MAYPSNSSLSVIFSNLQKASEKQQKPKTAELFGRLAVDFDKGSSEVNDFVGLKDLVSNELSEKYPEVQAAADSVKDRGALRALVWGQKVAAIQKSLIDRYLLKGDELLIGKALFVCEACGFVSLGADVPEICPVCKAPASRFSKV
ncbi:MAG: rubredoxin [Spirochaetales bacterium]|nr:rubredoxin [Spirochaetales bacterium]